MIQRLVRHATTAIALAFAVSAAAGAELYDIGTAKPARVVDARYFATHLHRLVPVAEPDAHATPWPAGQIGALRVWDSGPRWADLEPARGAFRFDRLDTYVAQAQAHD